MTDHWDNPAGTDGFEDGRVVGDLVLQIGVLDEDVVPRRVREGRADRRALAPIALVPDQPDST